MQLHAPVFNAADSQQVFHQADQPCGIVVNIQIELFARRHVETVPRGQEIAGISRDGCQRCAQIVGDRAQKVRAELFIASPQYFFFLFALDPLFLQSHRALAQDRDDQVSVERVCLVGRIIFRAVTGDSIYPVMAADRKKTHRIKRIIVGPAAGLLPGHEDPFYGGQALDVGGLFRGR